MFVRNAINIPAATANVTAAADVVADRIVNINEKKNSHSNEHSCQTK